MAESEWPLEVDRPEKWKLLERLCKLSNEVARASFRFKPLEPIFFFCLDRSKLEHTELWVCDVLYRGIFDIPYASYFEARDVGLEVPYPVHVIMFNLFVIEFSDKAVRTMIAHELLHAAGLLSEKEVWNRTQEAARRKPELFATRRELWEGWKVVMRRRKLWRKKFRVEIEKLIKRSETLEDLYTVLRPARTTLDKCIQPYESLVPFLE